MELSDTAFIRLAHSMYGLQSDTTVRADLETLLATTKLSSTTKVYALYYLHLLLTHRTSLVSTSHHTQFRSSSREKLLPARHRRTAADLFELLVVLMMISNKTNDDSSYTMKTWENLTPLKTALLRKKELCVLKKLNYNVFPKADEEDKWMMQLYNLAIKLDTEHAAIPQVQNAPLPLPMSLPLSLQLPQLQMFSSPYLPAQPNETFPLTPRSPTVELIQPLQPNKRRIHSIDQTPYKRPHYNTRVSNNQYAYSNSNQQQVFPTAAITSTSSLHSFPQFQLLTPLKRFDYDFPQAHPQECSCCAMTRMTDVYHSTLRNKL